MDDFVKITDEGVVPNDVGSVDKLDSLLLTQADEGGSAVDYSDSLHQIAELLAYQDMLIVVLTVVVVIFLGVFCGYLVTRWMRNR